MRNPELYLIGERMKKAKLVSYFLLGIFVGIVFGIILHSFFVGVIGSIVFGIAFIIISRKFYWIISNNGIYTPLNFGILNYLYIVFKYILLDDDKDDIVFIHYRQIAYVNLIEKIKALGIQIVKKDNELISIVLKEELFNQDLLNSIEYIQRKGIEVRNKDVLKHIHITCHEELKIKKIKL